VRLGKHHLVRQYRRMPRPAIDLAALTPDEKFEPIDELWGLEPKGFVLTGEQQAELDRRLERVEREEAS
jgi:putative addiction module component (TIGR02574 family)